MLELKDTSCVIKGGSRTKILDHISLRFKSGSFTVITGPNGSGKSTLAEIIMGIKNPTTGKILLDKNDITEKSIVVRELALVKVVAPPTVRAEINSIVEPFRAATIDTGKNVVTYQVTGNPEKIDAFIDLLKPYGIKDLTRTGVTAFVRETQKVHTPQLSIL